MISITTTNNNNSNNNNRNNNVPVFYTIKDLIQDDKETFEEEFTCVICMEFSTVSTKWYQCSKCSHFACHHCWDRVLKSSQRNCMTCRVQIRSFTEGLSRCRFIEQSFANKKINCPYSFNENIKFNTIDNLFIKDLENGCRESVRIKDLEEHANQCESRYIKCSNIGCNKADIRYKDKSKHQDTECQFAILVCEFCSSSVKRALFENHQSKCPYMIKCSKCSAKVKKSGLLEHLNKDCGDLLVSCTFKGQGCGSGLMKRSELATHMQRIDHSKYMVELINRQSQQLDNQQKEMDRLKKEISEQSRTINRLSHQLLEYEQMGLDSLADIRNKVEALESADFQDKIYSNNWTISNFRHKVNQGRINSNTFKIFKYSFYCTIRECEDKNFIRFELWRNDDYDEALDVDYSIKVINWKASDIKESISPEPLETLCGCIITFPNSLFSKNKGTINRSNSLSLQISVSINRAPLFS